ncbi:MAG TPA: DUF523 domain-containing protein [Candidatus Egerieicola pullicola]|uniref:DUF523 domain-containing protein n=1 Tax=Candidatus Egerieicola pullicola TaxID=2840775 RepID=A0A9D1AHW6_9FIRM|nr:DUF523 domain-containing protein [Candidatus Egerieicola pullicola]
MAKIAVSACLLGHCCKYNGGHNKNQDVLDFLQDQGAEILPVCPETAGGLPRPRPPAEIQPDGRVVDNTGTDVTAAFQAGAEREFCRVMEAGCSSAVLKAKSPSCGVGQIYDGSFTGALTAGDGIFAAKLRRAGVALFTEKELPKK